MYVKRASRNLTKVRNAKLFRIITRDRIFVAKYDRFFVVFCDKKKKNNEKARLYLVNFKSQCQLIADRRRTRSYFSTEKMQKENSYFSSLFRTKCATSAQGNPETISFAFLPHTRAQTHTYIHILKTQGVPLRGRR